jgi:hypothetical protein
MKSLQNTKTIAKILGTGVTNGATATAAIDRLGYDYVSLDLVMGTADVVSNAPSVLKLSHSDTTDATNYADLTGFVGGTSFTIGNANTSTENIVRFNVDGRGVKRYVKLTVSPRTTQAAVVVARLNKGEDIPDSVTEQGLTVQVSG